MTWTSLSILLAIGALHSASLWLVTLFAKRLGAPANVLRITPLVLGIVSAYLAFPLALRAVAGVELVGIEERLLGALVGVPAAAGAEAVYRLAWSTVPRVVDALLGRLGHGE